MTRYGELTGLELLYDKLLLLNNVPPGRRHRLPVDYQTSALEGEADRLLELGDDAVDTFLDGDEEDQQKLVADHHLKALDAAFVELFGRL